jgi:hypothetical protein
MNMESVDVVKPAVPGFGDDWKRPEISFHIGTAMMNLPGDDGVTNYADAVRVGDHNRAIEEPRIVDPGCPGHFAVAVEGEPSGEDRVIAGFAAGMDGGDAGAHRPFANHEFAAARDERSVADFHTFDICDGVVRAGCAVERDAEFAGARLGLGCGSAAEDQNSQDGVTEGM